MALRRLAKLALASAGLAGAFAAGHFLHLPLPQPQAEAPPADPPVVAKAEPKPQPPVIYAVPSVPVSTPPPAPKVFPAPAFEVPTVPVAPLPPPSVTPVAPSAPPPLPTPPVVPRLDFVAEPPKVPVPPAEPEIVEAVASVHRFDGKYLGGDGKHALVYVETGDGKAEVRCRPLAAAIPNADEDAKAEAKSLAVPAGKTAFHGGRAFVAAPRELLVINADCQIEWRFSLPGKADGGETLLGVVGFRDGKAVVVSNRPAADGKKPLGRVYTLDAVTGEATALATVAEGFDLDAALLPASEGQMIAVAKERVITHSLNGGASLTAKVPAFPVAHAASTSSGVYVSTPDFVGIASDREFNPLVGGATGTAPARQDREDKHLYFTPLKSRDGKFSLMAVIDRGQPAGSQGKWMLPVAKAITAPPLLRGNSVYFVAGEVLYRADAKTGAVCWKLTLPLGPTDSLTELTFADGGLHASGAGVLVRVTERR